MKVRVNIDSADRILLKRNLNKNGKAQRFFTTEVVRLANPYVPFKTGGLKDKQVKVNPNSIQYNAPYAKKQYYNNAGFGNEGTVRGGLRGKMWIPRMWNDRGKDIVNSVAKFVGGRVG